MNTLLLVLVILAACGVAGAFLYAILRTRPAAPPILVPTVQGPDHTPRPAAVEYHRSDQVSPPKHEDSLRLAKPADPRKAPLPRCRKCGAATGYKDDKCPKCGEPLR